MAKIPDGAKTATAEGADIKQAVASAADTLGLSPDRVAFTLDMSHFRNTAGGSVAKQTVKVIVWESADQPSGKPAPSKSKAKAAPEPAAHHEDKGSSAGAKRSKPSAEPSRARKPARRDDAAPSADRDDRGDALTKTPAAEAAEAWFVALLPLMGLEGTVAATGDDERVQLEVDVDKAGRLIGRRGSTLSAVRHLLRLALSEHGDFVIDVDIPDERGERKERSGRKARGPRNDDQPKRGSDDRGRGRRRGRRDDDERPRSEYPEDKLRAVGIKAAEKSLDEGKPVTINLVLNSYDRRIVHMAAQEVEGVESLSVVKDDGKKYVQIVPEEA